MSWRVTLHCNRAVAESLGERDDLFAECEPPPVLVADEPDPAAPDEWLLHGYFERRPTAAELTQLRELSGSTAEPRIEQLGEDDWVRLSQSGLEPIRAGRFLVHTPTNRPAAAAGATAFEIDAGMAFGTGQHATTAGCLAALDGLERDGARFANIADVGTGTGLLAFAALSLWPAARAIASDLDAVAVEVAHDNAAINGVALGHGRGELLLVIADGMDSPLLAARAPFGLIIANILAGPLIELAADFVAALAPGGRLILAGLLDSQARRVAEAYASRGLTLLDAGSGEWPVLVLGKRA